MFYLVVIVIMMKDVKEFLEIVLQIHAVYLEEITKRLPYPVRFWHRAIPILPAHVIFCVGLKPKLEKLLRDFRWYRRWKGGWWECWLDKRALRHGHYISEWVSIPEKNMLNEGLPYLWMDVHIKPLPFGHAVYKKIKTEVWIKRKK